MRPLFSQTANVLGVIWSICATCARVSLTDVKVAGMAVIGKSGKLYQVGTGEVKRDGGLGSEVSTSNTHVVSTRQVQQIASQIALKIKKRVHLKKQLKPHKPW